MLPLADDLAVMFDRLVKEKGYENRSEAFRDLVRRALEDENPLVPAPGPEFCGISLPRYVNLA